MLPVDLLFLGNFASLFTITPSSPISISPSLETNNICFFGWVGLHAIMFPSSVGGPHFPRVLGGTKSKAQSVDVYGTYWKQHPTLVIPPPASISQSHVASTKKRFAVCRAFLFLRLTSELESLTPYSELHNWTVIASEINRNNSEVKCDWRGIKQNQRSLSSELEITR